MTVKEYLRDGSVQGEVEITEIIGGERPAVRTKATWFHAQGGGQKADRGLIGAAEVYSVRHADDGEVDHFVASVAGLEIGQRVPFVVDAAWRRLNARFHTAGHLIAAICEDLTPGVVATNGHQWPGEARVEFGGDGVERIVTSAPYLEDALANVIANRLPVVMIGDPFSSRAIKIGGHKPIPCGGTHVANIEEIGQIKLRSAKAKGGGVRLGYEVI